MSAAPTHFRPEIQGLRAWAVMLVFLFHLWPESLRGGFIGVDVFFVISGYLITGILLREAEKTGTVSLKSFYARRIRRLMPAASLVLLASTAMLPLIPRVEWEQNAFHLVASTLYAENWWLAHQAVDYFGAEESPSLVQHYWSLAIEEQFYILWPLVMLGLCALKSRLPFRTLALWGLGTLTLISFMCSLWLTESSPRNAYFLTHTRLWELGVGGLLALSGYAVASARIRAVLLWAGLASILASAGCITPASGFPGWIALFPVLGSVAVLLSRGEGIGGKWLLNCRPAQFLGDISYAIYLWHWPLIVVWHAQVGELPLWGALLILAATIPLAWATRRYVETYFLTRGRWAADDGLMYRLGGTLAALCIFAAAAVYIYIHAYVYLATKNTPSPEDYPGAAVLLSGAVAPAGKELLPPLWQVKQDKPDVYRKDCHVGYGDDDPVACEYGDPKAETHIVLVGDSHAAQWVPALDAIAQKRGWRLTVFTKSACPLLPVLVGEDEPYQTCYDWGQSVVKWMKRVQPDLVVQTQAARTLAYAPSETREQRFEKTRDAVLRLWKELEDGGIDFIALRDTPAMPEDPTVCLSKDPKCAYPRAEVLRPDPLENAAIIDPAVPYVDMSDGICNAETCDVVVGNIIVWRDYEHMTMTYVRTLEEKLEKALLAAMAEGETK
ncbi:MAG: acyltransferase [Alphaproteobacteria bacterium]|nr:acyltransferase [Alphaproteobacteria bacterium]